MRSCNTPIPPTKIIFLLSIFAQILGDLHSMGQHETPDTDKPGTSRLPLSAGERRKTPLIVEIPTSSRGYPQDIALR